MIEASISQVGMDSLPQIAEIYNQIFRPTRTAVDLAKRYERRYNPLLLLAHSKDQPVGFFLGYEWKPSTYYGWFYGVLPECRRMSIGSQLMEAAQSWAAQNGYESIRLECHNQHRPMMHLAIDLGYDVAGLRWDADRAANLVIFEKALTPIGS